MEQGTLQYISWDHNMSSKPFRCSFPTAIPYTFQKCFFYEIKHKYTANECLLFMLSIQYSMNSLN